MFSYLQLALGNDSTMHEVGSPTFQLATAAYVKYVLVLYENFQDCDQKPLPCNPFRVSSSHFVRRAWSK